MPFPHLGMDDQHRALFVWSELNYDALTEEFTSHVWSVAFDGSDWSGWIPAEPVQLSALQAQLADAEDDDTRQQIQSQINMVTQQLNSLFREQSELEYQIQNAEKQKASLRQKVSEMKSEKSRCEQELSIAKKKKNQYQQKFDRLKTMLGTVNSNLDVYINATRKFESSSSSAA